MGQHWYDEVGEIDAVAALCGLVVKRAAGADIVTDVRNRHDGLEAASCLIRRCPNRIVKITCVTRVYGDDRQMTKVLAVIGGNWQAGNPFSFAFDGFGHFERNAVFVDRNQAETLWCKRIAKNLSNLGRLARGIAGHFG